MDDTALHIAIVDDHEIFRKGLRMVLNKSKLVSSIYEACDGEDFIKKLKDNKTDIVLMDVEMPNMNGIEATQRALKINPSLKIIALSMFNDDECIQNMLNAGVKGFLIKNINKNTLNKAILTVASGQVYYSEELWTFFTKKIFVQKQNDNLLKFTKREKQIMELLCDGMTNREIAEKLFVSERTIIGHKSNLLSKTNCKNAIGLISFAIKNKIINV